MKQLNLPCSVESLIAMDRMYMDLHYGPDYRWYEVQVVLNDYLDDENCDGSISSITTIFQVLSDVTEKSADVNVIMITHNGEDTEIAVNHGFWIEDYCLNDEKIEVTFDEAYDKVCQVNLPKPHSKHVVLRNPIGPKSINTQYVFGNTRSQIWVDAVTGEAVNSNPAFPTQLAKPLGEWP